MNVSFNRLGPKPDSNSYSHHEKWKLNCQILLQRENLWKIYISFTYGSPNYSNENFEYFNVTLKCLFGNFPSNLVIGDFNYPKIEWDYYTSKSNDMNFKFIECIRDCFFEQHVKEHTWGRGTNNASLLDLVLTNNNDFIDNVSVKAPLSKSDHSLIEVVLQNYPLPSCTEMWNYSKADFENMKALFNAEFNKS